MTFLQEQTRKWFEQIVKNTQNFAPQPVTENKDTVLLPTNQVNGAGWNDWFDQMEIKRITDFKEWEQALWQVRGAKKCGLDFETTGLDPWLDEIRLIQLAIPRYGGQQRNQLVKDNGLEPVNGTSAIVYVLDIKEFNQDEILPGLVELMESSNIQVITHNGVFEQKMLRQQWKKRVNARNLFDTMLASQLATAGDYIPESQMEDWCQRNGICKETVDKKTMFVDLNKQEIYFEVDTKMIYGKRVKVYYPTHRLRDLAYRHLGVLLDKSHQKDNWEQEISEEMIRYAALDAAILIPLAEILSNLLYKNEVLETAQIEFDCLPATAEIEWAGVPFNAAETRRLQKQEKQKLLLLEQAIQSEVKDLGFVPPPKKGNKQTAGLLNLNSYVDLKACLQWFGDREKVLSQDGSQFDFFNKETQQREVFPVVSNKSVIYRVEGRLPEGSQLKKFIQRLGEYRSLKSRIDGLESYLGKIHSETNRLHTSLRQLNPLGVGRFSASNPNLQQVSHDEDIRGLFNPGEGEKLISGDYSAIEMAIMAELSEDKTLLKAFNDGLDVHSYTAANLTGKAIEEVGRDERQAAKAVNFGLIYGMSAAGLREYAENSYGVRMTQDEADLAKEKFFQIYDGVASWQKQESQYQFENRFGVFHQHNFTKGYCFEWRPGTAALCGRVRVFPKEQKEARKSGKPYVAKVGAVTELYNTPDQGTGANIIKLAMAKVYHKLVVKGWEDVYLIITLHDELVLEAPADKAEHVKELLLEAMAEAWQQIITSTPIEISAAVGDSWAVKKEQKYRHDLWLRS